MTLKPILSDERGFTLIELMIVIAIIGILAAIAIPNFITYRQRGYDAAAHTDVKSAYTIARAYFTDYETGVVDDAKLLNYGFVPSGNVTTSAINGNSSNLQISSYHSSGTKTYTIDSQGTITK